MPGAKLRRGDRHRFVDRVDKDLEAGNQPSCLTVLARPRRMHERFGQVCAGMRRSSSA